MIRPPDRWSPLLPGGCLSGSWQQWCEKGTGQRPNKCYNKCKNPRRLPQFTRGRVTAATRAQDAPRYLQENGQLLQGPKNKKLQVRKIAPRLIHRPEKELEARPIFYVSYLLRAPTY